MTPEQRQDLRAKCEAATPGPWRRHGFAVRATGGVVSKRIGEPLRVAFCDNSPGAAWAAGVSLIQNLAVLLRDGKEADASYIAAASPDVVLGLLDRIEELEARPCAACAVRYGGSIGPGTVSFSHSCSGRGCKLCHP